jgi:hypothetical protein
VRRVVGWLPSFHLLWYRHVTISARWDTELMSRRTQSGGSARCTTLAAFSLAAWRGRGLFFSSYLRYVFTVESCPGHFSFIVLVTLPFRCSSSILAVIAIWTGQAALIIPHVRRFCDLKHCLSKTQHNALSSHKYRLGAPPPPPKLDHALTGLRMQDTRRLYCYFPYSCKRGTSSRLVESIMCG